MPHKELRLHLAAALEASSLFSGNLSPRVQLAASRNLEITIVHNFTHKIHFFILLKFYLINFSFLVCELLDLMQELD